MMSTIMKIMDKRARMGVTFQTVINAKHSIFKRVRSDWSFCNYGLWENSKGN